jgi:hypothetical protein
VTTTYVWEAADGTSYCVTVYDDAVGGDPELAIRPAGARTYGPPLDFVRREPATPRIRANPAVPPPWTDVPLPGMEVAGPPLIDDESGTAASGP